MAVLTFGFKLPAICTAKFTLRASLAERLAKVDFKNSAPLAALTLSLVGINLAVLHQSPDKRGVPLPVKMVSQLTQTWHSQVRSFC